MNNEMFETLKSSVLDRFCRYAAIGTQSMENVEKLPSTPEQWELAKLLEGELRQLGLQDVKLDAQCYVYATIPANIKGADAAAIPAVGFIAHVDTSPAVPGALVKPVVHRNYPGGDLKLPGNPDVVISAAHNTRLAKYIGRDIVTSDGTTLLGADDKAGVAAIMAAAEYLMKHPEIPHGAVKICFTPDEEVGRGADGFDVPGFGAAFAYTIDGEQEGELSDETFNAASAVVTFHGKNVHPGFAKDVMVNSQYALALFLSMFIAEPRPEITSGREGYLHPYDVTGSEEISVVKVLIRDFDLASLEARKKRVQEMAEAVRKAFPKVRVDVELKDSYRNMNVALVDQPHVTDIAREAMKKLGIEVVYRPIRGGTDGARLTFKGLPCPNVFCGCENAHSREEWVAVDAMAKSAATVLQIVDIVKDRRQ
ncbi:MAG TPA: peptidase T [Candidatus Ozemobacteraceae bacterium]|nr:peptidase T [Candidatus Ozemobacteraceae bacterium]